MSVVAGGHSRGVGRPGGLPRLVDPPMNGLMAYAQKMTDVEMQALWAYLRSLPPTPSPEK